MPDDCCPPGPHSRIACHFDERVRENSAAAETGFEAKLAAAGFARLREARVSMWYTAVWERAT